MYVTLVRIKNFFFVFKYFKLMVDRPTVIASNCEMSVYDIKDHPDYKFRPGQNIVRVGGFENLMPVRIFFVCLITCRCIFLYSEVQAYGGAEGPVTWILCHMGRVMLTFIKKNSLAHTAFQTDLSTG